MDIEVICIDDGSTDDSLSICQNIAEYDPRVKVISKINGGVASARNIGLEHANGVYITFADQDDWIEKNIYKAMVDAALSSNADMVVCNYFKDNKDLIQPMINQEIIPEIITTTNDLIRYAFFREKYRGFAAFVWNKIFKKAFLETNHILFDESLKRGDDVLFFSNVALAKPKTIYINQHLYHYVQRPDSVTHTLNKNNMGRLSEILSGYKRSIDKLEQNNVSKEALGYMKCFYVYHASVLYELAIEKGMSDTKDIYKNAMKLYLHEYEKQNQNDDIRINRIYKLIGKT